MVVPRIIVCPICGKKTYLRIEYGEYLYEYPIRVYCMNCRALMKGVVTMESVTRKRGIHMFNAQIIEDVCVHQGAEREIEADYIAEISGELPSKKTHVFDGKLQYSSPFLDATDQLNMVNRIEQLKCYITNIREWEKWKSIAFQLLNEYEIDYVPTALHNMMGTYPYQCTDYLKSLHCLQEVVEEESRFLFTAESEFKAFSQFINLLSMIDRGSIHSFVKRIGGITTIINAYRKVISIFSDFMSVYPNLLPAETYIQYKNKDDSSLGLSTCSFTDIKTFYQDAYETLMSLMYIPVSLDNIMVRRDYMKYHEEYYQFYKKPHIKQRYERMADDLERYFGLDNGKKADLIIQFEPVQSQLQIPVNRQLRNSLVHNTFKYDGLEQMITAYDQKNPTQVNLRISLLDLAVDCIRLARATVLMGELLLFILRLEDADHHSIIHPRYYKNLQRNDKCPCGSGKKYKVCCMKDIDSVQASTN